MKKNKNQTNNKKIIILIIIAVIIILLAIFGIYKLLSNGEVKNTNFWDYDHSNQIKICKQDEMNCHRTKYDVYNLIELKYDYQELNDALDKVNKETMRLYEESLASDINDSACDKVRSKYNYRLSNFTHYENYENDSVISIAIQRMQTDLCTTDVKSSTFETIVYDKKNHKMLTQDEFVQSVNVTRDEILSGIKEANAFIEKDENIKVPEDETYDDAVVFYGSNGDILVAYTFEGVDGMYTATVRASGK